MSRLTIANEQQELFIKITLHGAAQSGKTSLLKRYLYNEFQFDVHSTDSSYYKVKKDIAVTSASGSSYRVTQQIWDRPGYGSPDYSSETFYKNAMAHIVCFDMTNKKSIDSLTDILPPLLKEISDNAVLILVGTKKDLNNLRCNQSNEVAIYAQNNKITYLETSALEENDEATKAVFNSLVDTLIKKLEAGKQITINDPNESLQLETHKIKLAELSSTLNSALDELNTDLNKPPRFGGLFQGTFYPITKKTARDSLLLIKNEIDRGDIADTTAAKNKLLDFFNRNPDARKLNELKCVYSLLLISENLTSKAVMRQV